MAGSKQTTDRRSAQDEILVEALGSGMSYASAAEMAKVSRRTVSRRMNGDPDFVRRVSARRGEYVTEVAGQLSALGPTAVATIVDCLNDEEGRTRLAAARLILDMGIKVRTLMDIERDLDEIRRSIAGEL